MEMSRRAALPLAGVLALLVVYAAREAGEEPASRALDPGAVPMLDRSRHRVPLEEVVFDTFDGRYVRLSDASERLARELRDRIKPVYRPRYGDADALAWLRDGDLVIGYFAESGAYAYPVKVLNARELVNDVIDGEPILVSYCPLCASGIVYSRRLEGETLLFGNTSALYESDLVMYDHQTGSYWFQVGGEAIVGKLTGKRLRLLPSVTTTWGEWKRLHPETRLLVGDGDETFGRRYASDPYAGYAKALDDGRFAFPVSAEKLDGRLRASELVMTVEVGSAVKAYPLRLLGEAVVNDRVGGAPVLVLSRKEGSLGAAFLARAGGRRLTFAREDGSLVDRETGSRWDASGLAVAGPLEGERLRPLPARRGFWFSLAGAHPGLDLYRSAGRKGAAPVPPRPSFLDRESRLRRLLEPRL